MLARAILEKKKIYIIKPICFSVFGLEFVGSSSRIVAFVWVFWELVFDISEIEDDTFRGFSLRRDILVSVLLFWLFWLLLLLFLFVDSSSIGARITWIVAFVWVFCEIVFDVL